MHFSGTSTAAILGVSLLWLVAPGAAQAGDPIVIGEKHVLHSDVLDEDRTLRIHVPEHEDDSVFPILVVLDGEENFDSVVGLARQLVRGELLPELIIVGVDNTYRMWHSTTVWEEYQGPPSGGAVDFSTFLEDEMLPYIEANYPAADHRTIIGHSIGGVLLNYLLATHPQLFQGYISVSPSTWWRDAGFDEQLLEAWKDESNVPQREVSLYLSLADEDATSSEGMRTGFHDLEAFLRNTAPATLNWSAEQFPYENHISTYLPAVQHGLRHVFAGWNMQPFYDSGDIEGLKAHLRMLSSQFHYSVPPSTSWELALMGRRATSDGDTSRAVEILSWGAEFFPNTMSIHNFLGEAYEAQKEYELALAAYQHSLKLARASGSPMIEWIDRNLQDVKKAMQEGSSN